uniref:SHOCT domain-containing protein n=1 Tax=Candidatus Desulfatibia profunda TaxID=2841695 RepID=A0A8J6NM39_9BACT|nr:SHOCT domain-containing protein [Candidatus Desulfatibia profunda]
MTEGIIEDFHSDVTIQLVNENTPEDVIPTGKRLFDNKDSKCGKIECAELHLWTGQLIEILEGELKKRGIKVAPDAEKVLKIKIKDINFYLPFMGFHVRAWVDFNVDVGGVYSKSFIGRGKSGGTGLRAYGNAMLWSAVEILNDPDIQKYIREPIEKAITPAKDDDVEDKLEKLKTLFDKGLITQEEYDSKKTELLEKF